MKTGKLLIPEEWIVMPNIPQTEADYAGVIETRNGGNAIPHFVFFGRKKSDICELSGTERLLLLTMAADLSESFGKVLEEYLSIPKDDNWVIVDVSVAEYAEIKEPGFFCILEEEAYGLNVDNMPYGAIIVRDSIE